ICAVASKKILECFVNFKKTIVPTPEKTQGKRKNYRPTTFREFNTNPFFEKFTIEILFKKRRKRLNVSWRKDKLTIREQIRFFLKTGMQSSGICFVRHIKRLNLKTPIPSFFVILI